MDSVLIEKVDWVFYYNFEGAEWELPDRQFYDPDRQVKGCKYRVSFDARDTTNFRSMQLR